jgi:hypothetical protein
MQKRQTHFEQIPLDAIKQIIDGEILQKTKPEPAPQIHVRTAEELLLAAAGDRTGGRQ